MRLIIAAIGLLVFCFALALPATGAGEAIRWTEEEQAFLAKDLTIIVGGEMDWPPLDFVEDGVYQGVAKDYLDQISTLTGLRFEITTGHTWSELLTMISEKEIDMVPMMYWSEQRGRDFNLTSPFITVRHYAFAKDTSPKFRSLSDLSGYSVAIPSGYASIDHIDQHYPDINIIEVGTVIEAIDSVLTGKADVVIENTASIAYYTKQQNIVGLVPAFPIKFEINDVQMAVRQDLPILRDILQKGLDQISVPQATEIMQRWTDSENSAKNFLTEQLVLTGIQKEYAEKKAHLVACVNAAMAPFEAYNRGRHEGVAADYLELISKSFGAPARLVPVGSWDEAKGHLQSGKCDLVTLAPAQIHEDSSFLVSDSYIEEQLGIATRNNESFYRSIADLPKNEKIGIPADYIDLPGLRKKYSGIQFVTKSTVVDGLAAVDSGELFAMLAFTPTLSLYTQRNYEGSLKISGNFKNDTAKLAIATSADSVVLKSIVDASLESVPNSRRQNIYNKWVAVSIHRQVDYVLLKKLAIPLVVLASFLCFNLWQQRKHRKQIELKNSQLEEMNNLLSQKNAAAMHMAHHDPLTGLCNRAKLLDDLDSLLKVSKRSSAQFGCMFLDLDRFKAVNDTMGHSAGDELLKRVAERISNTLRETDTLYRVGGDEFMVLMQAFASGYSPSIVARRLIHCLTEPFIIEGKTVSIGTSIGIAVCPDDTTDHEELLKFADSAMYVAKANGRNGFHFHDGVLSDQISRITEVEAALREQSPEQAFHLEFQPIIDLRTGLAEKAEALIRWNHPRLGQIEPAEFIPIAEEAGLINSIGEWVLRESCKSMRDIQNSGCNISSIAINVSSKEFSAGDLVGRFRDTLSSFDLKAEQVEIEICEQYMQEFSSAAKLGALRALGHKICIDNFGSGSFSLLYVHSLPLSTLKLDRVFVRNLPASPNDVAIAQAILSLASSLGYKVVAEGVETAEQLASLRGMKCDYVQGFYFCKPLPLDKFVGRVAEINARQGFNDAGLSKSANDDGEDSTIAV